MASDPVFPDSGPIQLSDDEFSKIMDKVSEHDPEKLEAAILAVSKQIITSENAKKTVGSILGILSEALPFVKLALLAAI
jgi:hypothetical protein